MDLPTIKMLATALVIWTGGGATVAYHLFTPRSEAKLIQAEVKSLKEDAREIKDGQRRIEDRQIQIIRKLGE